MTDPFELWSYLAREPLLWLTLTLVAYLAADTAARRLGHPLANPVLIAVVLIGAVLLLTGIPYERYFEGAQFVHFMLGPATVALALPLHANLARLKRAFLPMMAALVAGSLTAILSALGIARIEVVANYLDTIFFQTEHFRSKRGTHAQSGHADALEYRATIW